MDDHPIDDYYVITSRRGEFPDRWSWEIRRKSKPLGIKMTGDGYQSDTAAQFAGSKCWRNFWPTYRKKKNAHASKTASVGGLSSPRTKDNGPHNDPGGYQHPV